MFEMNTGYAPRIPDLVENPQLLDELDPEDLFSLQAALQEMDDPHLDDLWELVLARTGSLS
jgi:hypothetical protein